MFAAVPASNAAPAHSTAASPAPQLRTYFQRMTAVDRTYQTLSERSSALLARFGRASLKLTASNRSQWPSIKAGFSGLAADFVQVAIQAATVVPPRELAYPHRSVVKAYQVRSQSERLIVSVVEGYTTWATRMDQGLVGLAEDGLAKTHAILTRRDSLDDRIGDLRTTWQIAVTAAARRLQVTVPTWVKKY